MKTNTIVTRIAVVTMTVLIAVAFLFTENASASTASSAEQASQQIMAAIENHDSTVSIEYATTDSNPSEIAKTLFNGAFAQSDISDYYEYSVYDGYSVSYAYWEEDGLWNYEFVYKINYKTTKAQEKKFEKKLAKTVKSLKLNGKSDKAKVKKIYKYITKKVKYGKKAGANQFTAYSALVKGKSVCQGYSTLFYRMCAEAGVDSTLVTGKSKNQNHAWNIVKVGTKYYNVDSTWDAKAKKYSYFLKSNKGFKGHVRDAKFQTAAFNSAHPMAKKNLA